MPSAFRQLGHCVMGHLRTVKLTGESQIGHRTGGEATARRSKSVIEDDRMYGFGNGYHTPPNETRHRERANRLLTAKTLSSRSPVDTIVLHVVKLRLADALTQVQSPAYRRVLSSLEVD